MAGLGSLDEFCNRQRVGIGSAWFAIVAMSSSTAPPPQDEVLLPAQRTPRTAAARRAWRRRAPGAVVAPGPEPEPEGLRLFVPPQYRLLLPLQAPAGSAAVLAGEAIEETAPINPRHGSTACAPRRESAALPAMSSLRAPALKRDLLKMTKVMSCLTLEARHAPRHTAARRAWRRAAPSAVDMFALPEDLLVCILQQLTPTADEAAEAEESLFAEIVALRPAAAELGSAAAALLNASISTGG